MGQGLTGKNPVRVLFVCMGNICRSPTAEAVFKHHLVKSGLAREVYADSAGTHDYHVGDPPDARAQEAARKRGYDMNALRGRLVTYEDLMEFDYVLAMDEINLQHLRRNCLSEHRNKLRLLTEFSDKFSGSEIPDPYYGGPRGFDTVLDMIEGSVQGLIAQLKKDAGRSPEQPG